MPKRRKKSPVQNSVKNVRALIGMFLAIVVLIFLDSLGTSFSKSTIKAESLNNFAPKTLLSIKLKISPAYTVTPTPIPTVTITPAPLNTVQNLFVGSQSGFCLNVPVLMYHHIQPQSLAIEKKQTALNVDSGIFDQQIGYLKSNGYNIISAQELIDALKNHTQLGKSAVITIDDGYRDNYDYAFSVLKKYGAIANIAVIAGLVEGSDYLTWGQISEMAGSGIVKFMDHTWSHYSLGRGPMDKDVYEIQTAKQQIQDHTGQNIDILVYPNGSFGSTAVAAALSAGITGGFTTMPGAYQCESSIMTLHRTRIGNSPLSSYGI